MPIANCFTGKNNHKKKTSIISIALYKEKLKIAFRRTGVKWP